MKKKLNNFQLETKATKEQINNWKKLYSLFEKHPLSTEELVMNFGLFMKSSALAKILFLNELYEQIIDIPGTIVEFGVWLGQNICLFENLRAIYEPFNKNRRIIGFDTFSGYTGFSKIDVRSNVIKDGSYQVPKKYRAYLEDLLSFHEKNNILGNIKKHLLIEGNVLKTVPKFFKDNPETIVALAYFDLALYKPTKKCLEVIKPRLIPGSLILLDELNESSSPGETVAFREIFYDVDYIIRKSKFISDRSFVIIK